MATNRIFYGVLLISMALIYVMTNTWYTLTLLGLCISLPLISLVLMLFSRHGLTLSLSVPLSAEKQNAVLSWRMENASVFPIARLTFRVELENQLTGSRNMRKVSTTIGGRQIDEARLALVESKVGTVAVRTTHIRLYDAFGLFTLKKADLPEQSTVVYPTYRDVSVQMERPIETSGDSSRYAPEKPGQDVSEIFALREYAAGDEIRKIHWKLSSKLDKTVVRDFSLPLNYSIFLLMELTREKEEVVDTVVETYLSLSKALLENGLNHTLAWYDAGSGIFHSRDLDDFEQLDMAASEVLVSFPADADTAALDYYLASASRSGNNILIYVTAKPDPDKIAETGAVQAMRTVMVYETEAQLEAARQVIEVIPVKVTAGEEVTQITV